MDDLMEAIDVRAQVAELGEDVRCILNLCKTCQNLYREDVSKSIVVIPGHTIRSALWARLIFPIFCDDVYARA